MIRAVLDTSVLLSGIIGVTRETSTPGAILRAWQAGAFELITSEHIRTEVHRNLTKDPYFSSRLTTDDVTANLESLAFDATQVAVTVQVIGVATHPEDDLVLAAAVSAGADHLVSGDRQLQALGHFRAVSILGPRAFHTLIEQQPSDEGVDRDG